MPTVCVNSNAISDYVRAGSSSTSEQDLCVLGMSECARIRMRVAENPKTPKEMLHELARDECADVRIAVATNPFTPAVVLDRLSKDEDVFVRIGIAQEVTTPEYLLKALCFDENPYVAAEAEKTLTILGQRYGPLRGLPSREPTRFENNLSEETKDSDRLAS